MYTKLVIHGGLETVTGLHIGTGGSFSAIGAADSPVIRDVRDHLPMIPGSSLKGKLRTLLARKYAPQAKNPSMDTEEIQNLFGSTSKRGSLLFSDMFLNRERLQELQDMGINNTAEVKFENSIDRHKAIANPRQIERVIRGCLFDVQIICDVKSEEDAIRDLKLLAEGMRLLQLDYLGGNGSRGYGKVIFRDLSVICPDDSISGEALTKLTTILKAVEQP